LFYNIQSQTLISLLSLLSRRRCRKIPRRIRNRIRELLAILQRVKTMSVRDVVKMWMLDPSYTRRIVRLAVASFPDLIEYDEPTDTLKWRGETHDEG